MIDIRRALSGDAMLDPDTTPRVAHARVQLEPSGATTQTDTHGNFSIVARTTVAQSLIVSASGFDDWKMTGIQPSRSVQPVRVWLGSRSAGRARMLRQRAHALRRTTARGTSCQGELINGVDPPAGINVLIYQDHTSSWFGSNPIGSVQFPFMAYVKTVLPNEWPASWPADSLYAGAVAVKQWAWYMRRASSARVKGA